MFIFSSCLGPYFNSQITSLIFALICSEIAFFSNASSLKFSSLLECYVSNFDFHSNFPILARSGYPLLRFQEKKNTTGMTKKGQHRYPSSLFRCNLSQISRAQDSFQACYLLLLGLKDKKDGCQNWEELLKCENLQLQLQWTDHTQIKLPPKLLKKEKHSKTELVFFGRGFWIFLQSVLPK